MTKYIFVTGGVMSSLGKGITAASLGALLEARGYKVTVKKFDPYLNLDPGTMSPLQHGEVFVTDDGVETDLDLGHYERFLSSNTDRLSSITSGRIYDKVLDNERNGVYLGSTVQVIPHITDEIKSSVLAHDESYDVVMCEIGGTVGDIESEPFLEAIRQLKFELDDNSVLYIHVTYVPYLKASGELKTKPTQHAVKQLREIGIIPDILVCRSEYPIDDSTRGKIALFCNLKKHAVISAIDVPTIYQVPIMMRKEGLDTVAMNVLGLEQRNIDLSVWEEIVFRSKNPKGQVTIGIVGKYVGLKDAYLSLSEALTHGGIANQIKVNLKYIEAESLEEKKATEIFDGIDGILIPGGFGDRGIEGKISAVSYARNKDIPFFGICLGMQCAVVEFARNVLKLEDAASVEVAPNTSNPVIHYLEGQKDIKKMGGTMRLGAYSCTLDENSNAYRLYGKDVIRERHRHRLEFNNDYKDRFIRHGLSFSGVNTDNDLVEIVELKSHRWFMGCQFHPEFMSKPTACHPLFAGFVAAAMKYAADKEMEG